MSTIILSGLLSAIAGYVAHALRPYLRVGVHGVRTYHLRSELERHGMVALNAEDVYRASMAQQGSVKEEEPPEPEDPGSGGLVN